MKQKIGRNYFSMFQLSIGALIAILLPSSFLTDNKQDENMIKALFVYNFTKHIEWPQGKISDRFIIGIIGNTPVNDRLMEIMKDRKIKNLPVEVKKMSIADNLEVCDILYITKNESDCLKLINLKNVTFGILIITEEKTMSQNISCINIIEKDDRLKFELNKTTIKKEGFKISNQLNELASSGL